MPNGHPYKILAETLTVGTTIGRPKGCSLMNVTFYNLTLILCVVGQGLCSCRSVSSKTTRWYINITNIRFCSIQLRLKNLRESGSDKEKFPMFPQCFLNRYFRCRAEYIPYLHKNIPNTMSHILNHRCQ